MGIDRIIVYRITDYAIPFVFLQNEVLASEIYEDGAEQQLPDVVNEIWLGAKEDAIIFALFRVQQISRVCWQAHVMVLPGYRTQYAVTAAKVAMDWTRENIPNLRTLICHIPVCHPNVMFFVEKIGFSQVGIIPLSYCKDGEIVGTSIYSYSFEEE